jgi:uncharacterized protein
MWTPETLVAVAVIFILAGFVKGVAGIGLPTVAIALMAVFIGLKEGIALMVVPTVVTNVWQALVGGRFMVLVRRFWSLLLAAALGAWIGAGILAQGDAMVLAAMLGVLLCVYSAVGLAMPPVPPPGRAEPWLSPVMGLSGGLIGGMTGSYAVPGVVYLQALGLPRDALVQALGITFVVFTMALGTSLTRHGLMSSEIGTLSLAATAPALLGMALGQLVRHKLSEAAFRPVFFSVLLVLGVWLAVRPLFG